MLAKPLCGSAEPGGPLAKADNASPISTGSVITAGGDESAPSPAPKMQGTAPPLKIHPPARPPLDPSSPKTLLCAGEGRDSGLPALPLTHSWTLANPFAPLDPHLPPPNPEAASWRD